MGIPLVAMGIGAATGVLSEILAEALKKKPDMPKIIRELQAHRQERIAYQMGLGATKTAAARQVDAELGQEIEAARREGDFNPSILDAVSMGVLGAIGGPIAGKVLGAGAKAAGGLIGKGKGMLGKAKGMLGKGKAPVAKAATPPAPAPAAAPPAAAPAPAPTPAAAPPAASPSATPVAVEAEVIGPEEARAWDALLRRKAGAPPNIAGPPSRPRIGYDEFASATPVAVEAEVIGPEEAQVWDALLRRKAGAPPNIAGPPSRPRIGYDEFASATPATMEGTMPFAPTAMRSRANKIAREKSEAFAGRRAVEAQRKSAQMEQAWEQQSVEDMLAGIFR